MSGITVVSPSPDADLGLTETYRNRQIVRRVWNSDWQSPTEAVAEICAAAPDVVLLVDDVAADDSLDIVREIDRRYPSVGVVVIDGGDAHDGTVALLKAGARDVLPAGAEGERVAAAVEQVLSLVALRRSNQSAGSGDRRRVIVLLSPKGGTGKTTIATNLAVGLAQKAPNRVLLLDLDVQFGDASSSLGLTPEHSLANAVARSAIERTALKVFLTSHESTLAVLPPPDDFAAAEAIEPDSLKHVVAQMVEEFPFVVIDTAAGIDEFSLLSLEFATDLLFVTTPDVPAIRAIHRHLEALDAIGMQGHRRHLLVNRADTRAGLTTRDIESTLGLQASFEIPTSRAIPAATNQGIPLLQSNSRDAAAKVLRSIVDHFVPASIESPSATGFWPFGKKK